MTDYVPRSSWTDTAPGGSAMTSPVGFAVHWPAASRAYGVLSREAEALVIQAFRRFHVSTNGWADVAYQVCITQTGRVWTLRGEGRKSAGNGTGPLNTKWGALLLLLGPGEEPSPAMHQAIQEWRRDRWLKRYPNARLITTHGAIRPGGTACPGPAATAHVLFGTWLRDPAPVGVAAPEPNPSPIAPPPPAPKPAPVRPAPPRPTQEAIVADNFPTLARGANGQAVKVLQGLLAAHGLVTYKGQAPDGDYGPRTDAAALTFCKRVGLVSAGYTGGISVGTKVMRALVNAN